MIEEQQKLDLNYKYLELIVTSHNPKNIISKFFKEKKKKYHQQSTTKS